VLRSVSNFKAGKKNGKALIYDETGTLILDMMFDMDNLVAAKTKKMMDDEAAAAANDKKDASSTDNVSQEKAAETNTQPVQKTN
jgi:hypothetical protein